MIKIKSVLLFMIGISILLPTVWYGNMYYQQNKSKALYDKAKKEYTIKYAYLIVKSSLDQVVYAENKEDGLKLVDYYNRLAQYNRKIESGEIQRKRQYNIITGDTGYIEPFSIPVKLKYISVEKPIFIEYMDEKSGISKGYIFNTDCWGHIEVFLATSELHTNLPPNDCLEKFKSHLDNLPASSMNTGNLSDYGLHCN